MYPVSMARSVPPASSMRFQVILHAALDGIGQPFDVFAAAHRVGRIGDAGFIRDDLLGAQRDARGLLGGQRQRFVARVGVQRLRAAQYRRHGL